MKRRLEITSQKRAIPNQAMLHEAVKSNDKCTVEQILATNSDGAFLTDEAFDPFNPGRVRPFVIAIRENKDEIVAIFLRFPNAVTATDIANAIYCDKLEIIGPWIDGIIGKHPKNFCDEQLDVLLSAAVGSNKIGAVKFIISKYPVNINMSHLIIAIDSHHLEMFSFLLILGAKIDDKDHRNYRLLECAIYHKETAALELVLRSGANVNIQDKQRWTVLHRVVDRVDVDKVRLLLKYNADVYIKNNRGSTPQDIVWNKIQNGQGGTRENRDIVHQLLSEAMDSQKKIESNNYYQGMLREPVNNFQHTSGIIDLTDANVLVKTNQLQTKVFNQSSQPHIAIPSNMVGKIPTLPHAPLQKTTKQNIGTALYKTLAFTSANALLRNNDNTKPCLEYSISYFKSKVILITKEAIKNTDKPVFILAGKGKDSLVPDIKTISSTKKRNKYLFITNKHNAKSLASNIKIILVFTRAEYAAITGLPEGTSVLVIDTLNSHTHGLVKEEHHGTINSRRIAAFIGCEFLHRQYKVTTAIMMNDNIDSVKFQVKFGMQNNLEHDWDHFYNSLTTNMIDNNSIRNSKTTIICTQPISTRYCNGV